MPDAFLNAVKTLGEAWHIYIYVYVYIHRVRVHRTRPERFGMREDGRRQRGIKA